ncbi:MMPL family transporter [Jiangella sp. DSM 45060]|uniref:MMPL family transporter n=1 Tax=Jiangella sp. DSM 45060 TaxID=1798224 RepID=UPI00087BE099|nr:MMPL family transporter [Jiangella sp. DSM 45060]SDT13560.1 putative drug exporter of the RND superfamily [Jiangella sp. DSM 45060]
MAADSAVREPARAGVFVRIARFAQRHSLAAIGAWALVLAGIWVAASVTGDDYRNDVSLPGTESQHAADLLDEHGFGRAGDTLQIVFHADAGLDDPSVRDEVERALAEVAALPHVSGLESPYVSPATVAPDGTIGYATATLDVASDDLPLDDVRRIVDTAQSAEMSGLEVEVGGAAARLLAEGETGAAEAVGILAALVILVLMFGTVIAAGLPIVTALFAVGSTVGVIVVASHLFAITSYTQYLMVLVGLGVGIDYALLIFARYRTELLRGSAPGAAATTAIDSAGRTVFFAGTTVIVALLGLVTLGLGSVQGSALALALTVLATMIASLTLLPALLALFGRRFARQFTARAAKRAARHPGRTEGARWRRLATAVQRRPVAAIVLAVVVLGALAVPALNLRLGFADAGNDPPDTTSRQAYDLLAEGFGPGVNGPLLVVVDGGDGGAERPAEAAADTLAGTEGVAATTPPELSEDGRVATLLAIPESSPQDERTAGLVSALRGDVLPALSERTGADFLVGGATAATQDYAGKVADRMPYFIAIVVGLSLLILMAVFRSVLIPIKAAVLNLLSIGAALGAMTLVFQEGLFGIEPAPIEAYLPILVFAIVFGLSMDYEVFLVSRIHEERERTGSDAAAVREGLAHTGAVITAAGLIMILIFGAFMLSPQRLLQQIGFGMAVAIFVDAVIIRCLVVPAAMQLMGRWAWWMPPALARRLPRLNLESSPDTVTTQPAKERVP